MCVRGALGSPAIMCASHAVCVCNLSRGDPLLSKALVVLSCPRMGSLQWPDSSPKLPLLPGSGAPIPHSGCLAPGAGGAESPGVRATPAGPQHLKQQAGQGTPFQAGVPGVSGSSRAGSRFTRRAGCPLLPGTLGSRCQPQVHQGKGLLSLRPTSGKNQTQGESPKLPHRKAGRC